MTIPASETEAQGADTMEVRDPTRGQVIRTLRVDGPDAVRAAVARARHAQAEWAACPVRERGRLLRRVRRLLARDRATILDLLERETGKARFDVVGELMSVCMDIGHLARRAPRWLRTRRVSTRPLFGTRGRVVYKPRGVVGVISPWNAPLNLALGDAIPALLAGNAVVVKPSELAPLAVGRAIEIASGVLPPGVLQVVHGAGATGAALVDHADMICVTGSPETGRRVMQRAAPRLIPVLLELGGKDPMIVCADADLDRAAKAAAWGACMMTGQVCMSTERLYVERPVAEAFIDKLVAQVRAIRVGPNGPDADIDYGAFTSPRQIEIVERHVEDAIARGATLVTGGKRVGDGPGLYLEPTVLTNVTHAMRIMREESFGPVVPVMVVDDAAQALELANDSDYGLNASIWTRDVERGLELATRMETGNVCVNECLISAGVPTLPFGGVKQSGLGTRHGGAEGLRQFCIAQSQLIDPRMKGRSAAPRFPYSISSARRLEQAIALLFAWR